MTKDEAIAAMQDGKKVTHEWFDDKEWMTMQDGKILLEDGVRCQPFDFWRWRTNESWEEGYSLFEPKQTAESAPRFNFDNDPPIDINPYKD